MYASVLRMLCLVSAVTATLISLPNSRSRQDITDVLLGKAGKSQRVCVGTTTKTTTTSAKTSLPKDVFQRTAYKAVHNQFPGIPKWKKELYRIGMSQGAKADKPVWLTCYYGTEPGGEYDRHDGLCGMHTASANKIPQGAWIWSPEFGFRQVLDTGSSRNDTLAQHPLHKNGRHRWQPAECWADIWYPSPGHQRSWESGQTYHLAIILPAAKKEKRQQ